jgi:hypothetical protein
MSRGPGFAIELRESYHDLLADRWPVVVAPQADELLSSWLHRLALANGLAPRAFAGVLGGGSGMWSARMDSRLPETLAAWLSARTGFAADAISAMATPDKATTPLWLPQRETAQRRRSTWLQFCAPCLADDRAPYFRRCWRLASWVSCFRHGCGLRDRCPVCRAGLAPFAQADLAPQHICSHCGFDLRDATRISVTAAARRLERSIDDFSKARIAKGWPAIHAWVARLTRIPALAGFEAGRPLVELSASARIRCFERLAHGADEGAVAPRARRRRSARTAGADDGLMERFVDYVDARRRSRRAVPALDVDLAGLLAAYRHVIRRSSQTMARRDDRDRAA